MTQTIKETYSQRKTRHSKEFEDFKHIFFAFSNEQLEEGLKKLNATAKDIVSIGAGGYVLKAHVQEFKDLVARHSKESEDNIKANLLEALTYELRNHEYCITYDETDALEALDLEYEDVPPNIMQEACNIAAQNYC